MYKRQPLLDALEEILNPRVVTYTGKLYKAWQLLQGVGEEKNPYENVLREVASDLEALNKSLRALNASIGHYIDHGDTFTLGTEEIRAIAVPGHSPGSLAFYAPESGFVLSGDALFQLSIGRTDFPGGNHRQLIESIHKNLLTLPPETVVYPGHGPETEIGIERNENPFL